MLAAYPNQRGNAADLHEGAVWIDLLDPTDNETRLVQQVTGLHVPTRAELSEIETSSRLQHRGETFMLSLPTTAPGRAPAPVGFVLSKQRLLTVRFAKLPSFEAMAKDVGADGAPSDGMEIFLGLLEAMVDRLADMLEREANLLETVSRRIFQSQTEAARRPRRVDREMRASLRELGSAGDIMSRTRETLLGVGRIGQFVSGSADGWVSAAQHTRFATMHGDIHSLVDYAVNLSEKVQFLLDATLGFINIEQNNIIKVLTVVSIVGIPPTFVASLYGMNFKDIPELSWSFGYWYAWVVMILSAIVPVIIFRIRGWL